MAVKRGRKPKKDCRGCAAQSNGPFCKLGYVQGEQDACPKPRTEKAMIDEVMNNRNGY
jgi:hypothetical protein